MKKPKFLAASCLLLSVPVAAYALSMFPVRVTVDSQPTNYRALVIDGTTYVALRDVATLTGRRVGYNSATRTVNISGDGSGVTGAAMPDGTSTNNTSTDGASTVGVGGTNQRAGIEGRVGQLLVAPSAAIRVDAVKRSTENADYVILRGVVRNPSARQTSFSVKDAVLVDANGTLVKYKLSAREMSGRVYAPLQAGEESAFEIRFVTPTESFERAVITIRHGRTETVFRATF